MSLLNDNADRAIAVVVRGRDDRVRRIAARSFVVALGGLENPRLLLNANRQIKPGIGNRHDLVGRFFMEHLDVLCGDLVAPDLRRVTSAYGLVAQGRNSGVRTAICLTPDAQARHRVLNQAFEIEGVKARHGSSGYVAFRDLLRDASHGDLSDLADKVRAMVLDLEGLTSGAYTYATGGDDAVRLEVHSQAEQAPNPQSRVVLTDAVDRVGWRRIALDWRTTALDKHSLRFAVELLAREFGRVGAGRLRVPEWLLDDGDDWGGALQGNHHHIGTTRMADAAAPRRRRPGLSSLRGRQPLRCRQQRVSGLRHRQPDARDHPACLAAGRSAEGRSGAQSGLVKNRHGAVSAGRKSRRRRRIVAGRRERRNFRRPGGRRLRGADSAVRTIQDTTLAAVTRRALIVAYVVNLHVGRQLRSVERPLRKPPISIRHMINVQNERSRSGKNGKFRIF